RRTSGPPRTSAHRTSAPGRTSAPPVGVRGPVPDPPGGGGGSGPPPADRVGPPGLGAPGPAVPGAETPLPGAGRRTALRGPSGARPGRPRRPPGRPRLSRVAAAADEGVAPRRSVRDYLTQDEAFAGEPGRRFLLVLDEIQDPHNL